MLEEKTPKSGGAIKKIDVSVWERREIFAMYAGAAFPYFAVTASADAAKLHAFAKENQLSFYFALVYILVESADSIPEFHYRLKDREPVYVDRCIGYATHLSAGGDLFRSVRCDPADSITEFALRNREKSRIPSEENRPGAAGGHLEALNISAVPWITFTHIFRPVTDPGGDSIPKISVGRYEWREGKLFLPLSLQAHHGLMDGIHAGRFFENVQKNMDMLPER